MSSTNNSIETKATETPATTVETIAQKATPVHPLIANLVPYNQKRGLTEAECVALELPSTPKSKPRLGILESHLIIWGHADFNREDHDIITAFCKSQKMSKDDLVARVMMTWFTTNKAAITEAADGFVKAEMTVELAQKKQNALFTQLERLAREFPEMADSINAKIAALAKPATEAIAELTETDEAPTE